MFLFVVAKLGGEKNLMYYKSNLDYHADWSKVILVQKPRQPYYHIRVGTFQEGSS